jgi:parallel beta-helix repeat protein
MWNRHSVLVVIFFIVLSNLLVFIPPSGTSPLQSAYGASPPPIEDATNYWDTQWIVDSNVTYQNQTLIINGSIIIKEFVTLTLINVTLKLNGTGNLSRYIQVNDTGGLIIRDYDNDPLTISDASEITSNHTDGKHRFGFNITSGASFSMENSRLSECGELAGVSTKRGMCIRTDFAVVRNCRISNCYNGIIVYYSDNSRIENNTIDNISGDGISITNSPNSFIYNNTINVTSQNMVGIYVSGDCRGTILECNNIKTSGGFNSGIHLSNLCLSLDIISNTINCTDQDSRGIYCQASGVNITGNTIYCWNNPYYCIDLNNVNWINLTNNYMKAVDPFNVLDIGNAKNITIIGGTIIGIDTRTILCDNGARDLTFDGVTVITKGTQEAFGFIGTKNVLLVNCTINAQDEDIYLYSNSEVVVRNCNFELYVFSDTGSTLTEEYYLNMTVRDTQGDPVPGTNIQIKNKTGVTIYSGPPDASGYLDSVILTEAIHTQSASVNHTPHNVTVIAPDHQSWYSNPSMNRSRSLFVTLLKIGEKPSIHYTTDWDVSGTEEYWNETILMDGNITVDNGETLILHNCTVAMNCSQFNGQYHIEVRTGGTLRILDYDWDNSTSDDASLITDSPFDSNNGSSTDYAYNFTVDWGGTLEFRNSSIRDCGWASPNDWEQGICIYGDNAIIDHVDISSKFKGVVLNGGLGGRISYCDLTINSTNTDSLGIHTWDRVGFIAQNNSINMTGTGANKIGILIHNNTNSRIIGNNITAHSGTGWADGISVISGSNNWISENIVYHYVPGSSILFWNTTSATVRSNEIRIYSNWTTGLLVHNTTYSIISDNYLIQYAEGISIGIQNDCQDTLLEGNIIQGNSDGMDGIYLQNAYNNIKIFNTSINLTGTYSHGLRGIFSSQIQFNNFDVLISNMSSMGMLFQFCDNITGLISNITTTASASFSNGVWIEHSKDLLFGGLDITINNVFGSGVVFANGAESNLIVFSDINTTTVTSTSINGFNSTFNMVINSTLTTPLSADVVLDQNATLVFVNVSYSDRYIQDVNTQLIVGWYMNIQVQDASGQPMPNVNVNIERSDAIPVTNSITDSNGWIQWIPCIGYIANATLVDNSSNPHIINASNSTCWNLVMIDLSYNSQTMVIKLINEDPIIINPVTEIIIQEDGTRILKFNATDNEYNPIIWSINTTKSWVELNPGTGELKLSPNETHVGVHYFKIKARDVNYGYDEFNVKVTILNRAPVIQTIDIMTATEDTLYSVDYSSDDDPATTWALTNSPGWLNLDTSTGVLSGTPDNTHVGIWDINLTVTDGHGGITWNNFSLTVNNNPPSITTVDVITATEDQLYEVDYSSTDDGLGTITWSIISGPNWLSINSSTGVLTGTPNNAHVQNWGITISVDDGNGGTDQNSFTLTVKNTPPKILTNDLVWATEDSLYEVDYNSSDDGLGIMTWTLTTDAGGWLKIDGATGILSGTPLNAHVGVYSVNVTVTDNHEGVAWQTFKLTINNTNDAPTITTKDLLEATEDKEYSVNYKATDDDGDTVIWSIITEATWLKLDSETGELSGTPSNLDVGLWSVTIGCDDSNSGSDNHVFNLTVINVNDAPIIVHHLPLELYPNVIEGESLDFNITYIDEDSDKFTIEWTLDGEKVRSDVPFWRYQPEFGTAGDHDIIVNVTDFGGASASHRWIVIVNTTNRAPIIINFEPSGIKPILNSKTNSMTFSVNATDPDADQLSYEWFMNGEDTGERTSSYVLDRSLLDSEPGTYNLTVKVIDSEGSITEHTWTVEIEPESSKKDSSSDLTGIIILIVIIIIVILILIFILLRKKRSDIEDIFVISKAGILLAHKSKELRPDMDDTILSGMLTAIQDFIKDAFKDKTKFGLRRLDFGDSEIRLKRGNGFFIAVVLRGEEPKKLEDKLNKTIERIEAEYGKILANWKGNLSEVRGVKDQLGDLLK